ncbi:MAG: DUF4346 domain-containing protein [Deltaproteobacteria bacterium]|nr:DUF4346 domain-containing protein [Deltaproteobacteria bacterium]
MRGVTDAARIAKAVERLAKTIPPRTVPAPRLATNGVRRWKGEKPKKLVLDPGGYFVVYPDIERRQLYVEHYDNAGTLRNIVEGDNGIDIINIIIREKMVTRMDHSAYVARELALAEQAILRDSIFVQDRAPGDDK